MTEGRGGPDWPDIRLSIPTLVRRTISLCRRRSEPWHPHLRGNRFAVDPGSDITLASPTGRRLQLTLGCAKRESGLEWGAKTLSPTLHQASPAQVAQVAAAGALDQVDRKLEQANFPGVIDSLNHGAERILGTRDLRLGLFDD